MPAEAACTGSTSPTVSRSFSAEYPHMADWAFVVLRVLCLISLDVTFWRNYGVGAMNWRLMNGSFWIYRSYVDVDEIGL